MPYYLYIVTVKEATNAKSLGYVDEFADFRTAKKEVKRLRTEAPLSEEQHYKIIFAADRSEAEQSLLEYREQPIAREWEK